MKKSARILALVGLAVMFIFLGSGLAIPAYGQPSGDISEIEEALEAKDSIDVIVWLKGNLFTSPQYQDNLDIKRAEIASSQQNVLSTLAANDFRLKYRYVVTNGFAGSVTKTGFNKLKSNPSVARIFLDRQVHATLQQSRPLIGANLAENIGFTGKGVTVCVVDSGINYNHPNLGGCFGPGCKVVGGYDFINNDPDPMDDLGHGTPLAGIVASSHNLYRGIAPNATLTALKVFDSTGSGTFAAVSAAIDWCVNNAGTFNIKVITMSLGDGGQYTAGNCLPGPSDPALSNAYNAGLFIDAASGNNGYTGGISYPACAAPWVVSVGATYDANFGFQSWCINPACTSTCTDSTTFADKITCFSNRGPNLDLLAPGAQITSTSLAGGFVTLVGTSLSAPHVAGLAALLKQADPGLAPASMKTIMQNTGVPVFDSATGLTFPRINAFAAVAPYNAPPTIILPDITLSKNSGFNNNILYLPDYTTDPQVPSSQLVYTMVSQTNTSAVTCIVAAKYLDCSVIPNITGFGDVTIRANDTHLSSIDTLRITVVNLPPVLSPIGGTSVNEIQTLIIQLQATDPNNDSLTYNTDFYQYQPSPFTFNPSTGYFEWTPAFQDSGTYPVTFTVTDNEGLSDSETIFITVNNSIPTVPGFQTSDTRITFDSADSVYQSSVKNQNTLHFVWTDSRDGNAEIYYKKTDLNGNSLSADTRLTQDPGMSWDPFVIAREGIQIMWADDRDGNSEIYYKRLDFAGNIQTGDIRITNDPADSFSPKFAADSLPNHHLVWVDTRDGNPEIYYKKLSASSGNLTQDIRLTGDPALSLFPSVAVDSGNNAHIVWIDDRDGNSELYYTKLDPGGNTLIDDTRITLDAAESSFPAVAPGNSNSLHVVWVDERDGNAEIYYKKLDSNGGVLVGDTRVTSNPAISWFPSVFSDASGTVRLSWLDGRNVNNEIYYKALDDLGSNMTGDIRLTSDPEDSSKPAMLSEGLVFAVWEESRDGNREIYFKRSLASPTITSTPPTTAETGQLYTYDMDATDLDNDTLDYSLLQFPTTMTIDPSTGLISWTAKGNFTLGPQTNSTVGNFTIRARKLRFFPVPVTAQVSDGLGGVALQQWNISIKIGQGEACLPPGPC